MGPGLVYRTEPDKEKKKTEGTAKILDYTAVEMQGWRKTMEDAHITITQFAGDPNSALFAVFDGHGGIMEYVEYIWKNIGKEVAEFARRHFPGELEKNEKFIAKDYKEALIKTFLKMDELLTTDEGRKEISKITEEVKKQGPKEPSPFESDETEDEGVEMKGCTSNVVLIKDNKLYIANAGDSRSIAILVGGKVEELSKDHKPDREPETSRIIKAGGSVLNGRVEGNLNLSRALGDLHYKGNKELKPEEQMICSYPDVVTKDIGTEVQYLLMGCDGVYETKSSQDIGTFVLNELSTPGTKLTDAVCKLLDALISPDCIKTGGAGCDNMTCILVRFKSP